MASDEKVTIQYGHDQAHWFGFGADAAKPPTQYTIDDARAQLDYICQHYTTVKWARIVHADGTAEEAQRVRKADSVSRR